MCCLVSACGFSKEKRVTWFQAPGEDYVGFLIRVLINALAIYFTAAIVPGIALSGLMAALGAGLVLGLVNAVVRPILIFLTLPFTLLTLGLFLFVLNGLCLWLTSALVKGFEVHGFWSAVFGSILVSVVSWLLTTSVSDRGQIVVIRHWSSGEPGPIR
jgi:putative membrane protein